MPSTTRPRDSQRQRVYDSETAAGLYGPSIKFKTLDEIETYLDKVTGSAWFRRRWVNVGRSPMFGFALFEQKTWTLGDGRGRRRASGGMYDMKFPVSSRYQHIVLHELAHHIVERTYGPRVHPWHGWQFCAVLLELVTHEMGADAGKRLDAEFKAHKVRFRARRKRVMTDEQRQAAGERLAAARAARAA